MGERITQISWEAVLSMLDYEKNPACVDRILNDKHQNEGSVLLWRALKMTEKLECKARK